MAQGGRTWEPPLRINDNAPHDPEGPPDLRMTPVVAVDDHGAVGVAWYDRRDDPSRRCWHQYFAASDDGGASFSPNVRISTAPSCPDPDLAPSVYVSNAAPWEDPTRPTGADLALLPEAEARALRRELEIDAAIERAYGERAPAIRVGFDRGRNAWPGHYTGLAAGEPGVFHALWADRRGVGQALYTTRIRLLATPPAESAAVLATVDLTGEVALRVGAPRFQESAGLVHFELQVVNASERVLHAPLTVELIPSAGTDPEGTTEPLRWDFSALLGSVPALEPGQVSGALPVVLPVSVDEGLDLEFDFRVEGRVER